MPNLFECIMDACVEGELGVPSTTSNITQYDLVRWANKGQDIIADRTNCIEKRITFSSVADQLEYVPDSSFIRPIQIDFVQGTQNIYTLKNKDILKMRGLESWNTTSSHPDCFTMFNRKIRINPVVSSSAGTASMTASITASLTTITVDSTSSFPSHGRAIMDSEVFEYTGKTDTTFTGVTRGVEGTTASTHDGTSTAVTVTERDLNVWCVARYGDRIQRVYNTGTCLFTNASTTVTGTSTFFLANVFPGDQIGTGTNPSKWYTVASVTSNTVLVLTVAYGEATTLSTTYVASSVPDVPQENSELISLYLLYRIKKKLELEPMATQLQNEFDAKTDQLRTSFMYNNTTEYPDMQNEDNGGY